MNTRLLLNLLVLWSVLLAVAACSNDGDGVGEELPTLAVDVNDDSVESPDELDEEVEPTDVPTLLPTRDLNVRPTLPPTWTPTPAPTATLTPTPTPTEPVVIEQLPESCAFFAIDRENSTRDFAFGESPTIAWTDIDGAELYRLQVFDANGSLLDEQWLDQANYSIPADIFPEPGVYGWEVFPLDDIGDQMCYGRGGELHPMEQF